MPSPERVPSDGVGTCDNVLVDHQHFNRHDQCGALHYLARATSTRDSTERHSGACGPSRATQVPNGIPRSTYSYNVTPASTPAPWLRASKQRNATRKSASQPAYPKSCMNMYRSRRVRVAHRMHRRNLRRDRFRSFSAERRSTQRRTVRHTPHSTSHHLLRSSVQASIAHAMICK